MGGNGGVSGGGGVDRLKRCAGHGLGLLPNYSLGRPDFGGNPRGCREPTASPC